jgi:hypothetical protein
MLPNRREQGREGSRKLHLARGRTRILLLCALFLTGGCSDVVGPDPWESGDILDRLNALPGVQAVEIEAYYGYPRAFQLDITQPVDHDRPNGPTFTQRAYLSHASDTLPMVFAPSGYGTTPQSGQELAEILQANCLSVTHRFFPEARPQNPDWELLTVHQSARDHHRVVELMKEIYEGKWVSTGASKGGKTVVIHRRFFPEDVDATVAYVAPFLLSPEDERFEPYLRTRGTAEEREAVYAFQRRLLERKTELLPFYEDWFAERGYQYSLPISPAFQGSAISYEWNYFQRHDFSPATLPPPGASAREMVDHLAQVVRLHYKSDVWRDYFKAYVYQTLTETGGPVCEPYHLYHLLEEESQRPDIWTVYAFPPDLEFIYRWESMPDVISWAESQGDGIIYIYGEVDPWTAGAMPLMGGVDALKIIQPGQDHGVRIMELDQRELVLETLGRWLERSIDPVQAAPGIRVPSEAMLYGTPDDPTLSPIGY